MYKFAIEGINGSGKTPAIEHVRSGLESEGLSVAVFAPFHMVRTVGNVPDIFPLWQDEPERAIDLLHQTLDAIEVDVATSKPDIVIYDY